MWILVLAWANVLVQDITRALITIIKIIGTLNSSEQDSFVPVITLQLLQKG